MPSGRMFTIPVTFPSNIGNPVSGLGKFEIHVLSSSSSTRVLSELRVTAIEEFNGSTVRCTGSREDSVMSTIQIFPIGEFVFGYA